jgi:hypothetical protein
MLPAGVVPKVKQGGGNVLTWDCFFPCAGVKDFIKIAGIQSNYLQMLDTIPVNLI